jgi:deazaflavin-dependent oxidoreductase (nitroreductase family)
MPLPRWLARVNRRVFNPRSLKNGKWGVLTHVGRNSGLERQTPLGPAAFDSGFVFLVNYDSTKADWVLNVMQAGRASLLFEETTYELTNPRLVPKDEAGALLGDRFKPPPDWMNIEFMVMSIADGSGGGSW